MSLKIVGIAVGALLAFCGLAVGASGGAVLAQFGGDGTTSSGSREFSTSRTALVTQAADLNDIGEAADIIGDPRVRLSLHATDPRHGVFVGVGPAASVDRYLSAAAIDEVTDFDVHPFRFERRSRDGFGRPERPADQSFWVAQSSGHDGASLDWKIRSGEYRLVVMNADASPGVRTQGDVSLTIPHASAISWSLMGGGLALLLAGIATIVLSVRASAPSPRHSLAY